MNFITRSEIIVQINLPSGSETTLERAFGRNLVFTNAKDLEEPFRAINVDIKAAKYNFSRIHSKQGHPKERVVASGQIYGKDGHYR